MFHYCMAIREKKMKYAMGLAFCLIFAVSSVLADVTETKEYNFELKEGGRISLSNINGDVRIEGVSDNQVHVIAKKKAGSQKKLDELEIDVEATEDLVRIETRHPKRSMGWFNSGDDGNGSVDYELKVPASAELDTVETVNGNIEISGVKASVSIETVNGKMSLEGLAGNAKLDTVNGTIDAQFAVLGAGQRVKADAVNGRIVLHFPQNTSAEIHAETVNGSIDADDFALEPDKGFVGRDLDGRIGEGEARVHVDTVNGSITIQRSK
jgi:DUF4097 and DUF4098 domain-containing protein YvlB